MQRERHQRHQTGDNRVPVEDAGLGADLEVRPERLEEVAGGIERHAANHIAQGRAEEDGEQRAGQGEDAVEEAAPHGGVHMAAQLERQPAPHKHPQDHH